MTDTRHQIIQTTCDLLEMQGYHATGLKQIVTESQTPRGSLYYYFPGGKEELTAEALQTVGNIVLQRIKENLAAREHPVEAIREFILAVAHNVELSGYRTGGPITTVALETASTSERLRTVCEHIYLGWQDAFAQRLMQGGVGETRARRLASVIISAMEGGIILCRTARSPRPLESVAYEMSLLLENTL